MCYITTVYNKQQDTSSKSKKKEKSTDKGQANDDDKDEKKNDANTKDLSSTKFTEGYLTTKGQEVYICLQKGNNYTKMAIDSSSTVYQLKQKFIQKTKKKSKQEIKMEDMVFLFMGQVLNDQVMYKYYLLIQLWWYIVFKYVHITTQQYIICNTENIGLL